MWPLLSRIAGVFRRRRLDADLDNEVRFHLDMLVAEHLRRGTSPADARAEALRSFGGVTQMKEAYRDQRGLPWIETLLQDVRYGARTLLRTPAFTLAALLTLALGIGANTAIFSVINAVLLKPLPYPEPDRILRLVRQYPSGVSTRQTGLRYLFFRDNMRSFRSMAAWRDPTGINLAAAGEAEYVKTLSVSKEYFDVFGVQLAYGQPFVDEHDRPGGADVVILSDGVWRRQFGGSPSAIGATVRLGGRPFTVLGVMPPAFASIPPVDLYVPLRPGTTGPGGGSNYGVAGRLRPGISREQALAEAAAVLESFRRDFPAAVGKTELPAGLDPFQRSMSASVRPALLVMVGAVGMLLLIACANTANLLLARASGRGREIAVRAALGAGRGRIVRQLLTESVMLSIAGGAVGVLLAYWTVPGLMALTPPGFTVYQTVRLDATVLATTFAVAVATGLLFGLAPALSLSRRDLVGAFKDDGTRTTAGRRSGWLRKSLVVVEVALCTLLLVGAGLLVRTFVKLRAVDTGIDTTAVLTARMSLQGDRYAAPADLNQFFDRTLERIRRIPRVESAAVVSGVPIEQGLNLTVDILDGPERLDNQLTDWRYATAGYFEAMGIPLARGRAFDERDTGAAPRVAVISQEFSRQYFKDLDPIGRHVRVYDADGAIEIVGIARDVREQGLRTPLPAVMYVPAAQTHAAALRTTHGYFPVSWVIRTREAGPALVRALREEVRSVDPQQPFSDIRTMDEVKQSAMASERFQMTLLGTFAAIGLLLAAAGIYGLVAYSVMQRTREFGIRIALGATRRRILSSVVAQGAWLALAGVALGIAGSFAMTRLLRGFLYEISPLDPLTFIAVGLILLVIATAASLIPALRTVRLNPVTALREG